MKKITALLILLLSVTWVQAQIVYSTVYSDGFETSNGFPSNFVVKKQTTWNGTATTATGNLPYPSTGTFWKDLYSNGRASSKIYQVAVDLTEPHGGTQCLKFTIPNSCFVDLAPHDTVYTVRWRSADGKISFNTAAGEGTTKYEVTFWAKTDGADKAVLLNTSNPATYLTLTSTWQKFTIDRYCTGTNVTALGIDFVPAADASDYAVYIDDITIKQRLIANTYAATDVTSTGFTANWATVVGATSYNVYVEKSDGATPATWTSIAGSPFTVNDPNGTNLAVNSLEPGAYRYKVTATDGTVTTVYSNITAVTIGNTAISETKCNSVRIRKDYIDVISVGDEPIFIYNSNGQLTFTAICHPGVNTFKLSQKGLQIAKFGNAIYKIIP